MPSCLTRSSSAPSATLRGRINEFGKRFRILHIDGSHEYATVRADILLSKELLADGGMVIFDDVNSRHTPGVAAAVWTAVVHNGLIPHFVTTKLYASWNPIAPVDLSLLAHDWTWEPHAVADKTVLHLEGSGNARQRIRGWVPPVLLPTAIQLNQYLLRLTRAVRRFPSVGR